MTVEVQFSAIQPTPKLNPRAILSQLERGVDRFARQVIKPEFETTWQEPPTFKVENKSSRDEISAIIKTDNEIYYYNNEGTSIRWALMSNDWQSQTRPGRIPSRPGRGRVVIAGRRAMTARGIAPRPGIEGRHWDEQIVEKEQKGFETEMMKAMSIGAANVWR